MRNVLSSLNFIIVILKNKKLIDKQKMPAILNKILLKRRCGMPIKTEGKHYQIAEKYSLPRLTAMEGYVVNQICTHGNIDCHMDEIRHTEKKRKIEKTHKALKANLEYMKKGGKYDIYMASSLRSLEDFQKGERVAEKIEKKIPGIKIFCPGLHGVSKNAYPEDAYNEKGDLERLAIQKSKTMLLIDAKEGEMTFGKTVEAARFLLNSPKKPAIFICDKYMLDLFKNRHPMTLMGNASWSRGPHLVPTLNDALICLQDELGMLPHRTNLKRSKTGRKKTRAINHLCPHCDSILLRHPKWII